MTEPDLPKKRRKRKRIPKERPPRQDAVETSWRLFLAVPLPAPVVTLVGELVQDLSAEAWPVRWVAADTAHITLQFLGETTPERAELLRLALPGVVARHERFRLRTADLGVFPNQNRPRVLWLGLYGPTHRLSTLHAEIATLLRDYDFPADDGGFHPHITLGRVRDVRNEPVRDLPAKIVARFRQEAESGRASAANAIPVPVDEVVLYRSILTRAGSRYEAVVRCALGERVGGENAVSRPAGADGPA